MTAPEMSATRDVENAMSAIAEPARRVEAAQKNRWQTIRSNPKVVFIAFFAS